jgi:peptidoglycan/LPS O-acetylase OafA/YrhL
VVLVVVGHTIYSQLGSSYRWTEFASLGVLIFFVLSGFLITGLLCAEERRFGTISLRNFYLRRAFRILPAFVVFILVVMLLVHFQLVTDISRRAIIVALLFARNFFGSGPTLAHLWSLALEEQFYLVWPLCFRLIGRRSLLAPTLGVALAIVLYRGVAIYNAPYDYGQGIFEFRPDFRMDSILVGCAMALALDRRPGKAGPFSAFAQWTTRPVWVVPALLYWTLYWNVEAARSVYLSVQTALVCCLVFHVIAFPQSVAGALLRMRWICFMGLISYSLYLWQHPFIAVRYPSWGFIRDFPVCIFAAMAVATLSYFFVERPFLRLKHRFSNGR